MQVGHDRRFQRLKVKVIGQIKVMDQANALGLTSIEGSLFSSSMCNDEEKG